MGRLKPADEHRVHQIFQVSVILKGAHAMIECIGGITLALLKTDTIRDIVNALTQEELIEDPNDFIAAHLSSLAQNFSVQTKHFYAFYLLSHGVVKLLLVVGLLRESSGPIQRLWPFWGYSSHTKSIASPTRTGLG